MSVRPSSPAAQGSAGALPAVAWSALLSLAGAKFLLHAAVSARYGFFRDELYFLACGRHLQWGYVDDAPGIAILSRLALQLGGSLPAVRLLAALAGAGTVLLAGLLARELGGGRFAQVFAGLCTLAAPVFLVEHGLLCVGAFEPWFWLGCAWLALRAARSWDGRYWLALGAVAGLGILLKYTMGLVLVCFLLALVLSPSRRVLAWPPFWVGAFLAVLLALPALLWQVHNHWPLLADLANIRRLHKNVQLPPAAFLLQQAMMLHPLLAPVWIAGLVRLLRRPSERFLGFWYLALLAAMMALHGKDYYLAAFYPLLFAAGAAACEAWFRPRPRAVLAVLAGMLCALNASAFTPILPPARLKAWQARLGVREVKQERSFDGPLMQPFSDQFGWPELAQETAAIYRALPAEERARTAVFAANYGEAGAIDQFGPALGLPPAVCAHNAYSLWGPPAEEPAAVICLGVDRAGLERCFESVTEAGQHHHPWGMGYENRPIFIGRGLKRPIRELWPQITLWN
jgi:hypothetical protein